MDAVFFLTPQLESNEIKIAQGCLTRELSQEPSNPKPSTLAAKSSLYPRRNAFSHHLFVSFCRGQLLSSNSLSHTTGVEFILEKVKYELNVTRSSPSTYFVVLNNSTVDIETHRLSDGGLLISYDGKCHTGSQQQYIHSWRLRVEY